MPQYHLVYERNGNMWVSTVPYTGWEAVQNAYPGYMTSLEFNHLDELREFLREEYRLSESELDLSLEKGKAESPKPFTIRLHIR